MGKARRMPTRRETAPVGSSHAGHLLAMLSERLSSLVPPGSGYLTLIPCPTGRSPGVAGQGLLSSFAGHRQLTKHELHHSWYGCLYLRRKLHSPVHFPGLDPVDDDFSRSIAQALDVE